MYIKYVFVHWQPFFFFVDLWSITSLLKLATPVVDDVSWVCWYQFGRWSWYWKRYLPSDSIWICHADSVTNDKYYNVSNDAMAASCSSVPFVLNLCVNETKYINPIITHFLNQNWNLTGEVLPFLCKLLVYD